MTKNHRIPLSVPSLKGNELEYVSDCIRTEWVSSVGAYVNRFESRIADYVGARFAVACVNGTAALHVCLIVAGVGAGDEVIVPTLTFIAPVNAVTYVGARPVFIDCDEHLNIDVDAVRSFCENGCDCKDGKLVNKKTGRAVKAIVPVHVCGHPVDIDGLSKIAARYGLKIIEDATESLGSVYTEGRFKGRKTGSIGDLGCFSFNGNKIITTGGGGMIVTDDEALAARVRYLTTQARDDAERYVHGEVGYNYRLTNIQAAIGCAQMEKIDDYVATKRRNVALYKECLRDVEGVRLIDEPSYGKSNHWHYTLVVDEDAFGIDAVALKRRLSDENIETRFIWELNHRQRPFQDDVAWHIDRACALAPRCLNIPCSVTLTEDEVRRVCSAIRDASVQS